ncbi:MAG TPA: WD40 repeat domain-containing protein [Steroidobacteraceae bacterium]|nr:WD40 repeat domain-containing protein [Steroidobacteraceae bacterium]
MARLERRASVSLDTYIVDCAWAPSGAAIAVAGGEGAVVRVDGPAQAATPRVLGEHALGVLSIAWRPDGAEIASSGQDGAVAFWHGDSGDERMRMRPGTAWTEHLAYSPNGKVLAAATGKTVSLWSAAGERIHDFAQHSAAVTAIAWDKPGRDLAAATNGAMWVHRVELPRVASRSLEWPAACLTAAFSPNGKVLASGMQDGSVHFWYLINRRDSQMRGYSSKVQLTAWSANSRYLLTSAGAEIVGWDFSGKGPEGSRALQLVGHTERVECLAAHPSGPWLASGGRDWRLVLWSPGKSTRAIDAHLVDAEVSVLRWSPDGRFLAVGARNGQLAIYELVTSSASAAR